jgi:hypothetical protein
MRLCILLSAGPPHLNARGDYLGTIVRSPAILEALDIVKIPLPYLKMVLAGKWTVTTVEDGFRTISRYAWSCGCSATGEDGSTMEARCCATHDAALNGYSKLTGRSLVLRLPD